MKPMLKRRCRSEVETCPCSWINDRISRYRGSLSSICLPEPDREIFFRRYYYRESCREIGRRLNMQEHTVNVRLSRGREKLRKQFAALRNTY